MMLNTQTESCDYENRDVLTVSSSLEKNQPGFDLAIEALIQTRHKYIRARQISSTLVTAAQIQDLRRRRRGGRMGGQPGLCTRYLGAGTLDFIRHTGRSTRLNGSCPMRSRQGPSNAGAKAKPFRWVRLPVDYLR